MEPGPDAAGHAARGRIVGAPSRAEQAPLGGHTHEDRRGLRDLASSSVRSRSDALNLTHLFCV
eukprot:scaffold880_cov384-Prasinococcus_capsulatus_cf.AAC.5